MKKDPFCLRSFDPAVTDDCDLGLRCSAFQVDSQARQSPGSCCSVPGSVIMKRLAISGHWKIRSRGTRPAESGIGAKLGSDFRGRWAPPLEA